MIFSILIATVEGRAEKFTALRDHVQAQISDPSEVEIVSLCDNKEMTIGAKRQRLLEMATGDILAFY